jgi:hypothetical protein
MSTHSTVLFNATQGHQTLASLWAWAKPKLMQGQRLELSIKEAKRSTEQNRLMWARLGELSRQVVWHGQKLAPEDWKCMLSASLKKQRVVPAIEGGGFVVLGDSTSRMSVAEMNDLLSLIEAFGAQQGVKFADLAAAGVSD